MLGMVNKVLDDGRFGIEISLSDGEIASSIPSLPGNAGRKKGEEYDIIRYHQQNI